MSVETDLLALAVENAKLRFALAEAQEQCVELAVDAGELHATIKELQAHLTVLEAERDALRLAAARTDQDRHGV
ncbi:hypothetical protein [Methylobacterium tarhaniae]|uniref:hypothetical protein n=1 Tax=Methylobacterium tarhaniae TaxID=1187852 RepID=UPI0009F822DF|nr:hypothetical protein [Methylobacterium tarhaniae]